MAAKARRTFRVFEAGMGSVPEGLLLQVHRSAQRRQRRSFKGADVAAVDLNELISRMVKRGARGSNNVALILDCTINALRKLKPNSQSVIFGSYVMNNMDYPHVVKGEFTDAKDVFFNSALRALRPGGRLVLVNDKANMIDMLNDMKRLQISAFLRGISDRRLVDSASQSIRLRSTEEGRLKVMSHYLKVGPEFNRTVERMIKEGKLESYDDYARPVAIVIKKPSGRRNKKAEKNLAYDENDAMTNRVILQAYALKEAIEAGGAPKHIVFGI